MGKGHGVVCLAVCFVLFWFLFCLANSMCEKSLPSELPFEGQTKTLLFLLPLVCRQVIVVVAKGCLALRRSRFLRGLTGILL